MSAESGRRSAIHAISLRFMSDAVTLSGKWALTDIDAKDDVRWSLSR